MTTIVITILIALSLIIFRYFEKDSFSHLTDNEIIKLYSSIRLEHVSNKGNPYGDCGGISYYRISKIRRELKRRRTKK